MAISQALQAHLESGHTTLCHAWAIMRRDGEVLGFTDHDRALAFDGIAFRPDTGLSALAVQRATGLSVDNTEALGALSDNAISEADIVAGRYDDAEIRTWRVNWVQPDQRVEMFRGTLGELRRIDGAFQAEIRGLSATLNRPLGRVYQKPCSAVLGDDGCGFDLAQPGYTHEGVLRAVEDRQRLDFGPVAGFAPEWFARGRIEVLDGAAQGLSAAIKRDAIEAGARIVTLWEALRADLDAGDRVRLVAGCDKRFETCRLKFNNALNYQGFPDIPEEDWIMLHPAQAARSDGGSRR